MTNSSAAVSVDPTKPTVTSVGCVESWATSGMLSWVSPTALPAGASSVVYIACDPTSLARDTATLIGEGYELKDIRAFDIYPMTHHVETVALFTR